MLSKFNSAQGVNPPQKMPRQLLTSQGIHTVLSKDNNIWSHGDPSLINIYQTGEPENKRLLGSSDSFPVCLKYVSQLMNQPAPSNTCAPWHCVYRRSCLCVNTGSDQQPPGSGSSREAGPTRWMRWGRGGVGDYGEKPAALPNPGARQFEPQQDSFINCV